jgi:hypothetical protein
MIPSFFLRLWQRTYPFVIGPILVIAGVAVTQAILYGPSLLGWKVLLPVDILTQTQIYIPKTAETANIFPHDVIMSDLILFSEPARKLALSELRAGRFPAWSPFEYAGAATWRHPISPVLVLNYLFESPVALAWSQLLLAIVTGLGAYFFFRRALEVGHWPAASVACCFPISGTFIIWQGMGTPPVITWLPWLLLAVDHAVRRPWGWGGLATAVLTWLIIISGAIDIAGEVLLASGIYAVWCYLDHYGKGAIAWRSALSLFSVSSGWFAGFLLGAFVLLPMVEYAHTGSRMLQRAHGSEERPPVGLSALPHVVLPEMYGIHQAGSLYIANGNRPESAASAYAGFVATLFLAPLAFYSRRHRSVCVLWVVLGFLGLSWALNVPGIVSVMRLPGLNMMSYNRWVFVTSFCILAMAAIGLDVFWKGAISRRAWFGIPLALVVVICGWCIYRVFVLPEPIATHLGEAVKNGRQVAWVRNLVDVMAVQSAFGRSYAVAACLSLAAIIAWLLLWFRAKLPESRGLVLGGLLLADLLWFGWNVNAQCDWQFYYPRIPALEQVANSTAGRMVGFNCLPAKLSQVYGLRDVRGYDGVDPLRYLELMGLAADPQSPVLPYAALQWFVPKANPVPPDGIRLSPVLDMLGVRYVIFRGSPPAGLHPTIQSPDYWVLVNNSALPRVFVPRRVEMVKEDISRLAKLGSQDFNAREVAFVESAVSLPADCQGSAEVVDEIPTRIKVVAKMDTPGLMVLADRWDKGWRAYLNGERVPILETNHAISGVVLPAGPSTVEFRYEPQSFTWGLRLAGLGSLCLVGWAGLIKWRRKRGGGQVWGQN